jgi:hypothetical protein
MTFYKLEENTLLSGDPIIGPTYTLIADEYETNTYPVDGWYWFATEAEAREFFGLPPKEELE